jgi:misacylated tRNA(Ala) deacylase
MTKQLYHHDAYIKQFDASVEQVLDGGFVLDRSAFFPGGGGQPADEGTFQQGDNIWRITKIKRVGDAIVHYLDGEINPELGPVHGVLDWDRRLKLMRTHTAMHILCGVIWRDYSASVTGGNMQPLRARMDFEFESMHRDLVTEIEEKINYEASVERAVTSRTLEREEAFAIPDLIRTKINLLPKGISEVRIVEIDGLDLQADGGTHVSNTREVGPIKIVDYKSKGKINKRLVVSLEI